MSGSQFFNVTICSLLCFFQKRGLEITVFIFRFFFLSNFVLTTLFLFEIVVIASLGGAARRT